MAEEEREYEVTVISREDVTVYPKIATPVVSRIITYVAAGLPPHSITIPRDEWNVEKEKAIIRKDIEARLKMKKEIYKV